ncbi:histidinol dehydrogenase [Rhodocytophaga rosea]|uniref:Histidinol dehydrogenase n=1 Tax=Rhodocytophaga rosea TaxID=2704465 RepID=A0A6C0GPZ1_9BACT|nr:histidinol dehydrogenase [Rhodocytophaga rosea]QHT70129.1 histidinol dehydrogenase [Rhodocytophaga rosea]
MRIIKYPQASEWPQLLARPVMDISKIEAIVAPILEQVKNGGDEALRKLTLQIDKVVLEHLQVTPAEIAEAHKQVSVALKNAIASAKSNIERFHQAQQPQTIEKIETQPGVVCWRKNVGIQKVGLYIPGGTAPLFSTVLMLGIPAAIAGCQEIALCTPANRSGQVHPAILYAADIVGIRKIYKIGGAQAIAAMAYGTESISKVFKIFGPGNQYVTAAKQLINKEGIAIDMPAGPSEVAVYADDSAHAGFIAADLLSQAEHGTDSQVILVSACEQLINQVKEEVDTQLKVLPRANLAEQALANSKAFLVHTQEEAIDLLNEYAAEHLILATADAEIVGEKIVNAGSVFLGNYTPESCGDYASGTNHTLPTNGFAKAYSGVSVDSFVKKITFQHISPEGLLQLGPAVEEMAAAEELLAHKNAVSIRLKQLATS